MIKKLILVGLLVLLTACSHDKPLQAPCTYYDRSHCGPVVELKKNL